jgi:hypothetical protein
MTTVKVWTELLKTKATEESFSCNTTCHSADQEILYLLRNQKFRNRVHNSLLLVLIRRQIHPVKTFISYSLKILLLFVSRGLQTGLVLSGVPTNIWFVFIFQLNPPPPTFHTPWRDFHEIWLGLSDDRHHECDIATQYRPVFRKIRYSMKIAAVDILFSTGVGFSWNVVRR